MLDQLSMQKNIMAERMNGNTPSAGLSGGGGTPSAEAAQGGNPQALPR